MQSAPTDSSLNASDSAPMNTSELASLVRSQAETIAALKHQLDWFRRQMFGAKSDRRLLVEDARQISLGEVVDQGTAVAPAPPHKVS